MKPLSVKKSALCAIIAVSMFLLTGCAASKTSYDMPVSIDQRARYLFFLHGTITEMQGAYARHPRHGTYDYHRMVEAFTKRGFTVISEIRPRDTDIRRYAERVARQVTDLIDRGVPPEHVSVVGFSKGGAMTLYVAAMVHHPRVTFVALAGCGISERPRIAFERFLVASASDLQGRILSLYDTKDSICGSCEAAFHRAGGNISYREIVLHVGRGHGTFYAPRKEWLAPVVEWIEEAG